MELLSFSKLQNLKELNNNVKREDLSRIFATNNADNLFMEISEKGKGCDIFRMYENKKEVSLSLLLEFIMVQKHGIDVGKNLNESFGDAALLESFQSYFRFKVKGETYLSDLFGKMELNKDQWNISQYSIKQISIEQIFISLANNAKHDD